MYEAVMLKIMDERADAEKKERKKNRAQLARSLARIKKLTDEQIRNRDFIKELEECIKSFEEDENNEQNKEDDEE